MKKLFVLICSILLVNSAAAEKCSLVIPWGAGGSSDLAARALQKGNNYIIIDYKPGAYASVAISHLSNNPSTILLSPPVMYSSQNPIKEINVDIVRVMYGFDMSIATGKNINIDDLFSKKINVGISSFSIPQHAIALELQRNNPNIQIVTTGNDAKALPLLMNGDIDVYITISHIIKQWTQGFRNINVIKNLPFGENVTVREFNFTNFGFHGVMLHKSASEQQRAHADNCLNLATSSVEFKAEADKLGLKVINAKGSDSDRIVSTYLNIMKKYGL